MTHTITKLEVQKRNKRRVNVYLDGEFACGLPAITVAERRLKPNDSIDDEELADLARAANREDAWTRGADYASRAMHTRNELGTYLSGKGFDADAVGYALEKLEAYGYLDDAAYAQAFVKDRAGRFGAKKLEYDLLQKGVSRESIAAALDGLNSAEACAALAEKYVRTRRETADLCAKTARYLASKGFDWDTAREAAERAAGERDDG